MIYLAGWGVLYFALMISFFSMYRGRIFGAIAILFFAAIAILRGSTGTDTANYESMLSVLSLDAVLGGFEPGFALVGLFLVEFLGSAEAGVRAISALFFILVAFYYFRSDINESFFLMVYLAPAYFYTYSMNGLRIGIASIVLLLAVQEWRKEHIFKSSFAMLAAVSFHYTVLFSICYFFSALIKSFKIKYVFLLSIIAALIFYFIRDYIVFKLTAYSDFEPPSSLSGLSKVVVIFVLISGVFFSCLPSVFKIRVILLAVIFSSFAVVVTTFSYAGLRLLDLIAFIFPVTILILHDNANLFFNWKMKLSFLLAGLISAAAVYRGFLIEAGNGVSPFLPYKLSGDFIRNLF